MLPAQQAPLRGVAGPAASRPAAFACRRAAAPCMRLCCAVPAAHAACAVPPRRDILAIPETRADWWELYTRHLKPRVDAGSLKLALINSDRLRGPAS